MRAVLVLLVTLGAATAVAAAPGAMARVGPGVLRPVYAPEPGVTEIAVPAFELDRLPVTNGEFLGFVATHPRWRRDVVARVFADEGYLAHWTTPTALGEAVRDDQPVTRVSWFAARAYCAAQDKRLPTQNEWELAAAAGAHGPDGAAEPGWRARRLAWYATPTAAPLARVGAAAPNFWGVSDLHGLVWEWVLDFNSTMVSGDSREGPSAETMRFCGVGGLAAGDKEDYAGFLRAAFRGSLQARFTTATLGFRCARDIAAATP